MKQIRIITVLTFVVQILVKKIEATEGALLLQLIIVILLVTFVVHTFQRYILSFDCYR